MDFLECHFMDLEINLLYNSKCCIVFYMYWRAPRLALVATWVIQRLQNKYVYI